MKRRTSFGWIAVLLAAAIAVAGCSGSAPTTAGSAKPSQTAPKFTLPSLQQQSITFPEVGAKPTLLFFWASWCTGCNAEAPELVKLHAQYKDKVNLIGVNLTNRDSVEDAKKFAAKHGMPFPLLLDEKGDAAKAYQVQGTPTTIYLDAKGTIRDRSVGYRSADDVKKKFEQLLAY